MTPKDDQQHRKCPYGECTWASCKKKCQKAEFAATSTTTATKEEVANAAQERNGN